MIKQRKETIQQFIARVMEETLQDYIRKHYKDKMDFYFKTKKGL